MMKNLIFITVLIAWVGNGLARAEERSSNVEVRAVNPKAALLLSTTSMHGGIVQASDWHPSGGLLSVGSRTSSLGFEARGYSFINNVLTPLVGCDVHHGARVNALAWHPSGEFLALGGRNSVVDGRTFRLYEFDNVAMKLDEVSTAPFISHRIYALAWNNDGQYLASVERDFLGGTVGVILRIQEFNGSVLSTVVMLNDNVLGMQEESFTTVAWHPTAPIVAIGGVGSPNVKVYSFDGVGLSLVASATAGHIVRSLTWRPDGDYLAVGGEPISGKNLWVYAFDGVSLALVADALHGSASTHINTIDWHHDGDYLALGSGANASHQLRLLGFDGSVLSNLPYTNTKYQARVHSVRWEPTGAYLAACGVASAKSNKEIAIYSLGLPLARGEKGGGSNRVMDIGGGFGEEERLLGNAENYCVAD